MSKYLGIGLISGALGAVAVLILLHVTDDAAGWFGAIATFAAVWVALFPKKVGPNVQIIGELNIFEQVTRQPVAVEHEDLVLQTSEEAMKNNPDGLSVTLRIFFSNMGDTETLIKEWGFYDSYGVIHRELNPVIVKPGQVSLIEKEWDVEVDDVWWEFLLDDTSDEVKFEVTYYDGVQATFNINKKTQKIVKG